MSRAPWSACALSERGFFGGARVPVWTSAATAVGRDDSSGLGGGVGEVRERQ